MKYICISGVYIWRFQLKLPITPKYNHRDKLALYNIWKGQWATI